MTTHELHEVYSFTLMKNQAPYPLKERIIVRLKVEAELLDNHTLRLISIDENGSSAPIDAMIGDGYLEFETEQLQPLYATITEKEAIAEGVMRSSGVNSGNATSSTVYAMLTLSSGVLAYLLGKKRYDAYKH